MTRRSTARLAGPERYSLAEGILWDDRATLAVWVDIHNGDLVRDLDAPERTHLDDSVGAVALAEDGGYLVAGRTSLIAVAPDGAISRGPDLLEDHPTSRFNDGIVDPEGRFIIGTAPAGERTNDEVLLRITPGGRVETLRSDITLSNGLAFSSDGTLLHVDTYAKTVSAYSNGLWVTVLDTFTGYPDGITVDSEDRIWVAQYGAGIVQRFSFDGTVLETIEISTPEATCVGFIPQGLAITSGAESATDADAGAIFIAEVTATGVAEHRWAGSTTTPFWKREN
jgi:sugar lactone lactonase YvrE